MKILIIEEASVEYRAEIVDVSTPEANRLSTRLAVGTLVVKFHIEGGTIHTSVSDAITALRKYIDEHPLPK